MNVKSNGISAVRLREKDIELVRKWRNSSFNLKYLNYQKHISKTMQKEWFKEIDNFNNFYFIINHKGVKTGVANIKNIDWNEKTGEVGVLVSNQRYIGDSTNLLVALTMCDFCFKILGMKWVSSIVRSDNPRAEKFNLALGFQIYEKQNSPENLLYTLTKDSFYSSTKKYFLFWRPLNLFDGNITITFNVQDNWSGLTKKMEELLEQTGKPYFQKENKRIMKIRLINS